MSVRAFLSYSRRDEEMAKAIAGLLRVTDDFVFHDLDSIQPGEKWSEELEEALGQSELVVVCWCRHSKGSDWVRKEYEWAMEGGKKVVPLLVDDTPLPARLGEYQALDWRPMGKGSHPPRWRGLLLRIVAAAALLAVLGTGFVLAREMLTDARPASIDGPTAGADGPGRFPAGEPEPEPDGSAPVVLATATAVLALALGGLWAARRARRRAAAALLADRERIAAQLREELLRIHREAESPARG